MALCAFMLEDGIQSYLQFTLYERFMPHNELSSGVTTVAFSSIVTLVGSIYKLHTIVSSLRDTTQNPGPGPFCRFCCNGFTKNRIIITLMFIGAFSNGVMLVLRTGNIYFIYGEYELLFYISRPDSLIVVCIWLTFVSYSVTLVVYFTFDITKDKVFRILNLIGVFIYSNFLALLCLNIDPANDALMSSSFMGLITDGFTVAMPIGVGLFCHVLAFIYKCIRIDQRVSNNSMNNFTLERLRLV